MNELIKDLDNATYHSGDQLSASGLKLLMQSPLHYWNRNINPDREESKPTASMAKGTVTHTEILEPGDFDNRYIVVPEGLDKRTKEGKEAYRIIEESGKLPLSHNDYQDVKAMGDAALKNEIIKLLFMAEHSVEDSIFFERDGVKCRIRPDFYIAPCFDYPNGLIMDVKTTQDASERGFNRSIDTYNYDLQCEFYSYGFMQYFETHEKPKFLFFAIESSAPYANAMYELPDDVYQYATVQNEKLIALYKECKETDTWKGYSSEIVVLNAPQWKQSIIDNELFDMDFENFGDEV